MIIFRIFSLASLSINLYIEKYKKNKEKYNKSCSLVKEKTVFRFLKLKLKFF